MGNTNCCKINTKVQVQIIVSTQTSTIFTTYENFMNAHQNINATVTQSFSKGALFLDKKKYVTEYKEYLLSEGTFIGNKDLSENIKNGFGVMLYQDGKYYEGEWIDDKKSGHGLLAFEDGSYYFGSWKDDLAHGQGIHYSKNPKAVYNGNWQKGLRQGRGIEEYDDGSVYTGNFINDMKNGRGRLIYPNKTSYEGQFLDDTINGIGTFKGKNHTYEGSWKNGKMHGSGKSQWKNDKGMLLAKYIGEYCEGIKEGFGQYTDSKGVTYKATWINGEINERGPVIKQTLT